MSDEVWILGGTGRTGRAIGARVATAGLPVVLVGRDAARLSAVASRLDGAVSTRSATDIHAMAEAITAERPLVVVNTVGPYPATAALVARACLPHSSYVDLANDVAGMTAVLDLHAAAVDAGQTLVTGAAFGVLATEGIAAAICRGRPPAARIRVDSSPSAAAEAVPLGEAAARSIVDVVRGGAGGHRKRWTAPDGTALTTVAWPSGDLVAAQRVSGAADAVAATSALPSSSLTQVLFAVGGVVLEIRPVRELAVRRIAAVQPKEKPRPREYSWGRARVEWADGTVREGFLRMGDASEFTAAAAAAVAIRLARGRGPVGATTPAAAFGDDLVGEAGGEVLLNQTGERTLAGTSVTHLVNRLMCRDGRLRPPTAQGKAEPPVRPAAAGRAAGGSLPG